jgi:hypothetical protein
MRCGNVSRIAGKAEWAVAQRWVTAVASEERVIRGIRSIGRRR